MSGFRRAPDIFRVAITQAVDQDRLDAGFAAQLLVQRALDAGDPFEIRHAIIKEYVFIGGRVIAQEVPQDVHGRGVMRIGAHRLNFEIESG